MNSGIAISMVAVALAALSAPSLAHAEIPDWVKANAAWWSSGDIDDATFLGAIEYLANAGLITVPSQCLDVGGMTAETAAPSISPEWQSGPEPDRISVASEILESLTIQNLRFDQNAYVYGESPILLFEMSEPLATSVKLGVFDGDGNTLFSQRVNTDEFGNGRTVFSAPAYYVENERIEAIILVDGTSQKYTAHTTMTGLRADLETTPHPAQSGETVDMKFTLSTPAALPIAFKVTDEDHNTLHEGLVAINDFGIGSASFLAPEFYQTDRKLNVVTSFAASPEQEQVFGMPVVAQPITVKITTDRETYMYQDIMKIYIETEPPAPGEVISMDVVNECVQKWDALKQEQGGSWRITLDSEGRGIVDGMAYDPTRRGYSGVTNTNGCHDSMKDDLFAVETPGFVADSVIIKLR